MTLTLTLTLIQTLETFSILAIDMGNICGKFYQNSNQLKCYHIQKVAVSGVQTPLTFDF